MPDTPASADKSTGVPQIEVTPEMIEAAAAVLRGSGLVDEPHDGLITASIVREVLDAALIRVVPQMTIFDLITQLFEIAHNDEFSEQQRKSMMATAIDDFGKPHPPTFVALPSNGGDIFKKTVKDGVATFEWVAPATDTPAPSAA